MNTSPSERGRAHMGRVKELSCSVCCAPPPSEAHHINQNSPWTTVALCHDCHVSWHHGKELWRVYKMSELDALSKTIERMMK